MAYCIKMMMMMMMKSMMEYYAFYTVCLVFTHTHCTPLHTRTVEQLLIELSITKRERERDKERERIGASATTNAIQTLNEFTSKIKMNRNDKILLYYFECLSLIWCWRKAKMKNETKIEKKRERLNGKNK